MHSCYLIYYNNIPHLTTIDTILERNEEKKPTEFSVKAELYVTSSKTLSSYWGERFSKTRNQVSWVMKKNYSEMILVQGK